MPSGCGFLNAVGLGYISLDRSAATLSGGEGQRIRLATQIGSKLRGVLYVLDEPSIGLHHRDNDRLLQALESLRDLGNTVLVVEHDEDTIRRADYVIDLGPGAGRHGGEVGGQRHARRDHGIAAFADRPVHLRAEADRRIATSAASRTARRSRFWARARTISRTSMSAFPLGVMTVVTGVSGSGKSTLVNDILYRALAKKLYRSREEAGAHKSITGTRDTSTRSFASTSRRLAARRARIPPPTPACSRRSAISMPCCRSRASAATRLDASRSTLPGGRCEACQGEGQRRIEMNFLPDVYVLCEVCGGKRYNHETLAVKYKGYSIADLLETPVADALPVLENIPQIKQKLQTLVDVGLGYIHLGQSAVTLSGGEAQRIKLARELSKRQTGKTLVSAGRADDRAALRRRQQVARGAAPADRPGEQHHHHRAQYGRDPQRRLDHRPRPGGWRRRRTNRGTRDTRTGV